MCFYTWKLKIVLNIHVKYYMYICKISNFMLFFHGLRKCKIILNSICFLSNVKNPQNVAPLFPNNENTRAFGSQTAYGILLGSWTKISSYGTLYKIHPVVMGLFPGFRKLGLFVSFLGQNKSILTISRLAAWLSKSVSCIPEWSPPTNT